MIYKKRLCDISTKVNEIAKKNDTSEKVINNIKHLNEKVNNFKVKVPLMGGFNAGKTSLINKFLDDDRLPTNITPETTIAAEIIFSDEEKIVAHTKSGEIKEFKIDDIKNIKPYDYLYIEVFQNKIQIDKYNDIVIVDMPGLDSKIEAHNQAVLNYIKEGVFYVIVTDVDYGVKDSVLKFLKEINLYQIDFAVLITKTDHKMPEDAQEVVSNAKRVVSNIVGRDVFVGSTSIKDNSIEDFVNILDSIDIDQLTMKKFKPQFIEQIDKIIRELDIRRNYKTADTTEIETKISDINKSIKELELKVNEEGIKIENKFGAEVVENIITDVKMSLNNNISLLVQASKSGQDGFSRAVNEIIRPVLSQSVNRNVTLVLEESFQNINMGLEDIQGSLTSIHNSLPVAKEAFNKVSEAVKNPKIRTILAGVAIFTNVIAPWLEIIILFMPEIIKLFVNEENQIKNQIETKVIPQINMKLRPQIISALSQVKNEFIEKIRADVEENKNELVDSLNKAIKEKDVTITDFDKWKENIKNDINELQIIKEQL